MVVSPNVILQTPATVDMIIVQWGPMKFGDTALAFPLGGLTDRSVQVEGTFGSGTSVGVSGSLDAVNFISLRDSTHTVLAITTPDLEQILELSAWVKPVITAGDGTEAITVTMAFRRRAHS